MQSSIPPAISYKLANLGFVCAILVVFIHIIHPVYEKFNPTWWVCTFLQGSISCIAVPFFFVASGYFFAGHLGEEGWWRKGLRKRIGTLLVPYFLWNALFFGSLWGRSSCQAVAGDSDWGGGRVLEFVWDCFGVWAQSFHLERLWRALVCAYIIGVHGALTHFVDAAFVGKAMGDCMDGNFSSYVCLFDAGDFS